MLERQIISKRIAEIKNSISLLNNTLYRLDLTDLKHHPDSYELLSTDAALRSERITCRLRHLVYATTMVGRKEYLNSAGITAHDIEIKQENGITEITLPFLMPKRKQSQGSEFLDDPLLFTLRSYFEKNQMLRYKHCVVCFTHIYDRELSSRRIRDYDNLELKRTLDTIATFFMFDDCGLLCDMYNRTELGNKDCTRVSIMEKDNFPEWLAARKSTTDSNV